MGKPKSLILQDAETDPNGNPFPFVVLFRGEFHIYTDAVVERFATKQQAVSRAKLLVEQHFVVEVFKDVAYTLGND